MAHSKVLDMDKFLRESLECSVCTQLFKEPKRLECGHIFCLECLRLLFKNSEENFPPCPICRRLIIYPKDGVRHFPTQTFYQDVIDYLEDEEKRSLNFKRCGLCEKKHDLQIRCVTCSLEICENCTLTHSKLKPNCSTIPINEMNDASLNEMMSRRTVTCSKHNDDVLQFYCRRCDKAICEVCKITEHRNHVVIPLGIAANNSRQWLNNYCKFLQKNMERVKESDEIIVHITERFEQSVQEEENKLNNKFNSLVRILELKREAMLKEITHRKNDIQRRLNWQREKTETLQTELQTFSEIIQNGITYGVDSDVVMLHTEFKNSAKELNSRLASLPDSDFEINIHIELDDTEKIEEVVKAYNVGSLQVSQQLSMRHYYDTDISLHGNNNVSVACTENSLCAIFQERHGWLNWSNRVVLYMENNKTAQFRELECENGYFLGTTAMVALKKEHNFIMYHVTTNTFTEINPSSLIVRYHDLSQRGIYPCFPVTMDSTGNFVLYDFWNRQIIYRRESGEIIRVIKNDLTFNRPRTICTNNKNDILLLGEEMCRVLDSEGNLKHEFQLDNSIIKENSFCASQGCFDDHNNVITRVDLTTTTERKLVMMKKGHPWMENLILPTLPDGNKPTISTVSYKQSSVLYLLADKLSKLITCNYLPFIQ